ncbi:MAG: hypothetical protein VX498_11790 [Myxococcota bacterium]|nr:hypothetical protein [Myxococcota bacterium]
MTTPYLKSLPTKLLPTVLAGLFVLSGCYEVGSIHGPENSQSPGPTEPWNQGNGSNENGEWSGESDGDDYDWSTVQTPEIAENVVVIEDHPCFEEVTETYEDSSEELIFSFACDPSAVGLEVGSIVVGEANGGYLREITELEVSGYTVVAETIQARLAQVFLNGGFYQELSFEDDARATMDFSGKTLYSGTVDGSNVLVKLSEGMIRLDPNLTLAADFGWFSLESADAILRLNMEADLELLTQLSDRISYSGSTPLGTYRYPFAFAAGPVPVGGTLEVRLSAGFETSVEATATATVGVEAEGYVKVGGQYRNGDWHFINRKTWDSHRTGPDFDLQGDWAGKVWVKAEARVMLYRAAGPSFYAKPFIRGEAHAECYDIDWEFFAGASAGTGLHLDLYFWELNKNFGPWTWDTSIGSGNIELTVPLGTDCDGPTPGICEPAGTISCGSSVTGNTSGSVGTTQALNAYPVNVGNYEAPEVTYTWQATTSNEVEFAFVDPSPMDINHDIMILDGSSGQCMNTNAVEWGLNRVTFQPTAGTTYFVVVDGYDGDSGAFELELDCNP